MHAKNGNSIIKTTDSTFKNRCCVVLAQTNPGNNSIKKIQL
jgi:hypothetical protein